jgi:hypothetical protein
LKLAHLSFQDGSNVDLSYIRVENPPSFDLQVEMFWSTQPEASSINEASAAQLSVDESSPL